MMADGTKPAKDILVVVISKTPEKVAHFEVAAQETHVKFIDIHRLAAGYNVAPEDTRDRKDNARQKAGAVISLLKKLKDPRSIEHHNLIAQCQVLGIPYDPNKIFAMVEDSTFTTSPGVWPYLRKRLKGLVSKGLLEKYGGDDDRPDAEPGPGAETGPIVSAVGGFIRFYNLLLHSYYDAREKVGTLGADPEIKNQSTVVLMPLGASLDPSNSFEFDDEVSTKLLERADGTDYGGNRHITDPYAYVTAPDAEADLPISSKREVYVQESGPRARVFTKMYKDVFSKLPREPVASVIPEVKAAAVETTRPALPQTTKRVRYEKTLRERIYDVLNRDDMMASAGSKGIVFEPFDPNNFLSRIKAFYDLTSAVVAKQLIARDMFKPVIIWDDGCWEPLIKILASLANKGMAKDYIPFYEPKTDPDIKHVLSSFYDCLRFNPHKYDRDQMPSVIGDEVLAAARLRQAQALEEMSEAIIGERARDYHKFIEPTPQLAIRAEGTAPDTSRFTVAHFVSATSDNKTVIEQSQKLGAHLAKIGAGYVWGGMNMYAGGAAFKGYKAAGGVHAAAYSTVPIAAAETENGELPKDADYREWARDIYERMAGMIAASDVIVISPGGWGTFQELAALLVLKKQAPDLFANKKIIIHNPAIHDGQEFSGGPFWSRSIKAIFDIDHRNSDFSSVRDKDVFIVHNDRELAHQIDKLKELWEHQKRAVLVPVEMQSPQGPRNEL